MKRKHRNIVVDGEEFTWRVVRKDHETIVLRVWHAGRTARPWAEVEIECGDPWLAFPDQPEPSATVLTPEHVAALVRERLRSVLR
ncbi:MAG: hypothetical protein GY953_56120 [bacterium]|nr:hypothetical protein [bacterium]